MDFFTTFVVSAAAWLSIQAVPLLLTPKLVIAILTEASGSAPTDVEVYLARALATALFSIVALVLVLTGVIPVSSPGSDETQSTLSPYAYPTIIIVSAAEAAMTVLCYTRYTYTSSTGYALGTFGSGLLTAMGVWCCLFGAGSHISRRTGADKRVSGFMFPNSASAAKKGHRSSKVA